MSDDMVCVGGICRGCKASLDYNDAFCDLGYQPLVNDLSSSPTEAIAVYPTRPLVCRRCLLVQLPVVPDPTDLFPGGYPFFSGSSITWMKHCKEFANMAAKRWGLGATSRVIEIGSNDGTGLRRFRGLGIPALGIEPCHRLAKYAQMEGIATVEAFWSEKFATELVADHRSDLTKSGGANLIVANNVLAHVPDLHDFLRGIKVALAHGGVASIEVPFVGNLIGQKAFDQIYHEHHCYFSLYSLKHAVNRVGMEVLDVETVPTHGGSMRVTVGRGHLPVQVAAWLEGEAASGLHDVNTYLKFRPVPGEVRQRALESLFELSGQTVVGYGASAKAAVMLNHLGVGADEIPFVADITRAKWNRFIPGTGIRIAPESDLSRRAPDVVVNFCWNWKEESEKRIHELAPDAKILYLNQTGVPAWA